jgi:hypothetical protein
MKRSFSNVGLLLLAFVLTVFAYACATDPVSVDDPPATDEAQQDIGGGSCHPSDPGYPQCAEGGPTVPGPSCNGINFCYCACRYNNPCAANGTGCAARAACLTSCDRQYPAGCTGSSTPANPPNLAACL